MLQLLVETSKRSTLSNDCNSITVTLSILILTRLYFHNPSFRLPIFYTSKKFIFLFYIYIFTKTHSTNKFIVHKRAKTRVSFCETCGLAITQEVRAQRSAAASLAGWHAFRNIEHSLAGLIRYWEHTTYVINRFHQVGKAFEGLLATMLGLPCRRD